MVKKKKKASHRLENFSTAVLVGMPDRLVTRGLDLVLPVCLGVLVPYRGVPSIPVFLPELEGFLTSMLHRNR